MREPPWVHRPPAPLRPDAVREALALLRRLAGELPAAQAAVVTDPARVSELEWELERRLVSGLTAALGPCPVLAEEHFARHGAEIPGRGRVRLVLDPLDGSASYARGSDRYAVSLAVLVDDRAVLGLVQDPVRDRLFSAVAGGGAWLDGAPLPADPAPAGRRVVVVKRQHLGRPDMAAAVDRLAGYRLERMECTSIKLCWVAQGRRAGLVKWLSRSNGVLLEWGTTAGLVICGEVGLRPQRLSGRPWRGEDGGLVVADPACRRDLGFS